MPASALMYSSALFCTALFSNANWRLDSEAEPLTRVPTFWLSLSWATVTFSQTAPCDLELFAASLRSLVATTPAELLNTPTCSLPRRLQRPCSTQKADIGIFPDLAGTI